MALLNHFRLGWIPPSSSLLDALLHCTGCLLCRTHCLHENRVPDALIAGRALLREQHGVIHPVLERAEAEALRREAAHTATVSAHVPPSRRTDESSVWFLTDRILLEEFPEALEKLFRVFEALGIDSVAMPPDYDYGADLFWYESGRHSLHRQRVRANGLRLAGVRRILTDSPSLLYSLKTHYAADQPEIGNRSTWLWDFLMEHWPQGAVKRPCGLGRYTVHDSSYAGRYLGLYDSPRRLLRQLGASEPLELQHHHAAADTSGGFLWPWVFEEEGRKIAQRRFAVYAEREWDEPGLVVSSYESLRNFRRIPEARPRVVHLLDLIHDAVV